MQDILEHTLERLSKIIIISIVSPAMLLEFILFKLTFFRSESKIASLYRTFEGNAIVEVAANRMMVSVELIDNG